MKKIAADLDPRQAAGVFAVSLSRTPAGFGICKAPFRWDEAAGTADAQGYRVPAWREGGETGAGREKLHYTEERRFADLKRVRIHHDPAAACAVSVPAGRVAVALEPRRPAEAIVLAVGQSELAPLLSSLMVLAPQADLLEGR